MRVLLDTNIIIHREANRIKHNGIGTLFNWLDKLHYSKCIHPLTVDEIKKHSDPKTVQTMGIKLDNYNLLKTEAPQKPEVVALSKELDKTTNDFNDTRLINELANDRVDILITEDKNIHVKAKKLGINDRVYRIESFLEKVISENPGFVNYKTLAVKQELFGNLNLSEPFFDSFRKDYTGFDKWFNSKEGDLAYVCFEDNDLMAFLFLKRENESENYSEITPILPKKKRLKIGTFKVILNGYKLGERFLKIIFDNALKQKVEEIYVTIFNNTPEQERLIELLKKWGFIYWGIKKSPSGNEQVYIRNFEKNFNLANPKHSFPYISFNTTHFIVPIWAQYHTNLLPDSVLNTESPIDFIENEPFRNALSKVYISRSYEKNLKKGDNIIFYRTGEADTKKVYTSVVSTIGIVESVITDIKDVNAFITLCRKRSVFSDQELREYWDFGKVRPFIVNFLYTYSFPKRINLSKLIELGIIKNVNSVPRGFQKISKEHFQSILHETRTDESIIVY